jgi:hypothetical protein
MRPPGILLDNYAFGRVRVAKRFDEAAQIIVACVTTTNVVDLRTSIGE